MKSRLRRKRKEDSIVITLKDEDFKSLIIGVDDPNAAVELVENALNN